MARKQNDQILHDGNALWYKDAIIYQAHVRAFSDSNDDGIGDFRGLSSKLDYLRDLGVTAIWLLPFYPSPLRDDGYDIAHYTAIHPDYGTLADFRHFLREAHVRGLRVITELVLNHTSDQHPWFQRARRSPPGSAERNFYVWSDTTERYKDARIIFEDFEPSNWSWDPIAGAYFWHRFFHHQPDLNYENPKVVKSILQIMDFWLETGVDGLRLDAVPYLFEREGTNCENLPETHHLLREIRRHVDEKFACRMLLAEANQWPEDAVAYLGRGDECHMAFHFPVMPRLFMAVRMEDRYPVMDILEQTPKIPESCQWAVFLRNHDELTLEMVTDEERDYMYRVYAHDPRARLNLGIRRRLAPLLGNGRRRIELMNGLLFSLPGTPVLYYGDELGMGDNIFLGDRNGVRTPMQWSSDRNAGFSRANSQRLYLPVIIDPEYHYEAVNVEAQLNNPSSLLWWMRRLIALRKRFKSFGRGALKFLQPENRKVLAFTRNYEEEWVLVVANLSRFVQYAELDLSEFKGCQPVEVIGHTRFPAIGDLPYLLTLGPHSFYWFLLEPPEAHQAGDAAPGGEVCIDAGGDWQTIFSRDRKALLEQVLFSYLPNRRWFRGKARTLQTIEITDTVPFGEQERPAAIVLVTARYTEGDPETYQLPLTYAVGERARGLRQAAPGEVIARLLTSEGEGILTDALLDASLCNDLWEAIERRHRFKGAEGIVTAAPTRDFRKISAYPAGSRAPNLLKTGRGTSLISFGNAAVLKLFRRVGEGVNPDYQLGLFLSERMSFTHVPPVMGSLEYRVRQGELMTLAVLQGYVPNEGDAWNYTQDVLSRYFERMSSRSPSLQLPELSSRTPLELADEELPPMARELIGVYLESACLLGERIAGLHEALAHAKGPDQTPEPFTPLHQRSLYQSMRNQTDHVLELLRGRLDILSDDSRASGTAVLERRGEILAYSSSILGRKIAALRTRIHGNCRLEKILCTGKDFVILDFEGQPGWPLGTRRIKRSPLRDVAGMLRSFQDASNTALSNYMNVGQVHGDHLPTLKLYSDFWILWVSTAFLRAYMRSIAPRELIPRERSELAVLLDIFLLETAVDDLGQELVFRPDRAALPLDRILQLLKLWHGHPGRVPERE